MCVIDKLIHCTSFLLDLANFVVDLANHKLPPPTYANNGIIKTKDVLLLSNETLIRTSW